MPRPRITRVDKADQEQVMGDAAMRKKSTSPEGAEAQVKSLIDANELLDVACFNPKNVGLAAHRANLKASIEAALDKPLETATNNSDAPEKDVKSKLKDMKTPATEEQIEEAEFMKRVGEVFDVTAKTKHTIDKTDKAGKTDIINKFAEEGNNDPVAKAFADVSYKEGATTHAGIVDTFRSGGITRTQETAAMNYKNLAQVAAWYKSNPRGDNPLSLPLWQSELFGERLIQLATAAGKADNLENLADYFKNAKLQVPAKLRVACAGNMRVHTAGIEINGAKIVVRSLPHASHDSHDLGDPEQEVAFAQDSVESVMDSEFARSQRDSLKKSMGLNRADGLEMLQDFISSKHPNIDVEGKNIDQLLDELMPQLVTEDRFTSLVDEHDKNSSRVIDKAINRIQAGLKATGKKMKVMGTHHTIQSGFTIFAAIGTPFSKSQNQVAAEEINKQTKIKMAMLRFRLNSGKYPLSTEEISQIKGEIKALKGINESFNQGLNASNNAAILYGGSFSISTGLFIAGASALVAIGGVAAATAVVASLPITAPIILPIALAITALASIGSIGFGMKSFNDKFFGTNKMSSNFKGLKLASFLVMITSVVAVTAPVSLPIIGALSVAAVAGVVASTGLVGAVGAGLASWYRDSGVFGSRSNHTWNAALQSLNMALIGGVSSIACHEGKDRTGTVLMMQTAYLAFIKLNNGKHPDINNKEHQKELAKIFDVIIMSGHDAERTSMNCAGAASVKNLKDYIPAAIYSNMELVTKNRISSYKAITKYFSLKNTVARTEYLNQQEAESLASEKDERVKAIKKSQIDLLKIKMDTLDSEGGPSENNKHLVKEIQHQYKMITGQAEDKDLDEIKAYLENPTISESEPETVVAEQNTAEEHPSERQENKEVEADDDSMVFSSDDKEAEQVMGELGREVKREEAVQFSSEAAGVTASGSAASKRGEEQDPDSVADFRPD